MLRRGASLILELLAGCCGSSSTFKGAGGAAGVGVAGGGGSEAEEIDEISSSTRVALLGDVAFVELDVFVVSCSNELGRNGDLSGL